MVLERRGFSFAAKQSIHTVNTLYRRRTDSSINLGNALMARTLAADLAPEAATVSPIITGDHSSSLLVGIIGLPDVGTILAMQGSRGL